MTITGNTGAGGDAGPVDELLIVSGMSGAGKSSALKYLEDLGWEVIDNLPLFLLTALVSRRRRGRDPAKGPRYLSVGIDGRTQDFDPAGLVRAVLGYRKRAGMRVRLAFFDCEDAELQNRFTETRRRHPAARDRTVLDGIRQERPVIEALRDHADDIIDTTGLALPALRDQIRQRFHLADSKGLNVSVISFSYRRGLPRMADLVFDVRFLRNPYYDQDLRPKTGRDQEVAGYITEDERWQPFHDRLMGMLDLLVPCYQAEGKSYLTIAVGCTGGRHRSVFTTEKIAEHLREGGGHVTVQHRELGS